MSDLVLLAVPLRALVEQDVSLGELMDVVSEIFEQDTIMPDTLVERVEPLTDRGEFLAELLTDRGELLADFGEAGTDLVAKRRKLFVHA